MVPDLLQLPGAVDVEVLRPGEDRAGGDAVEADVGQALEEVVPVDLAQPRVDRVVLVDAGGVAGRVGDVAAAARGAVVEGVGDVVLARVLHDLAHVAALVEGVGGAVEEADVPGVDGADHVDPADAVLDEVVGVRLDIEQDPLLLDAGDNDVHRLPELGLGALGLLGASRELGVHLVAAELEGDVDGPVPVAHRGLALVLVRGGPAVQRQAGGELEAVVLQEPLGPLDLLVVGGGVGVVGPEVVALGELDVREAGLRGAAEVVLEGVPADLEGIHCDLHCRCLS